MMASNAYCIASARNPSLEAKANARIVGDQAPMVYKSVYPRQGLALLPGGVHRRVEVG